MLSYFFFSSRRRHTRGALVTGVQTCALPIFFWLRRLPETLEPGDVRPLDWRTMVAGWATVTRHRRAAGYMIASGMMQGALFGYLNSSEQIIAEVFDARSYFPLDRKSTRLNYSH